VIPNCCSKRCVRGFTLIEVMVALLMASIILVGVYGTLSRTLISRDIAEGRAELFATGRDTVLRMADEIEAALPPPAGDRIFFRGVSEGGRVPRGSIEFIKVNRGGYGRGQVRPGQVYVKYFLEPIVDKRGYYTLWRRETLFAALLDDAAGETAAEQSDDEEEPQGPIDVILPMLSCQTLPGQLDIPGSCTKTVGLRFTYLDGDSGSWRDEWDTLADPDDERIPVAVEIALTLEDERGVYREFKTVVDLPMARAQPTPRAGGGRAEDNGEGEGGGEGEEP